AVAGVRQGFESFPGDFFTAFFTAAESPLHDAVQRVVDLREELVFVLQETERDLFLVVVTAEVRGVNPHVGEAAAGLTSYPSQGLFLQFGQVATGAFLEREQPPPIVSDLCLVRRFRLRSRDSSTRHRVEDAPPPLAFLFLASHMPTREEF